MSSRLLRTVAFVALMGMIFAASCGTFFSAGAQDLDGAKPVTWEWNSADE